MNENDIATIVIGSCIKIHRKLGAGLLESAYQQCLFYELQKQGLKVEKEKNMPITYEEIIVDTGYRIDLLVEDKVVIELKSVIETTPIHWAQVMTYLKMGNYKLGLLINFNEALMKNGIHRIANKL
jgi:GxxExxY protein